jgi:hypothetical protein
MEPGEKVVGHQPLGPPCAGARRQQRDGRGDTLAQRLGKLRAADAAACADDRASTCRQLRGRSRPAAAKLGVRIPVQPVEPRNAPPVVELAERIRGPGIGVTSGSRQRRRRRGDFSAKRTRSPRRVGSEHAEARRALRPMAARRTDSGPPRRRSRAARASPRPPVRGPQPRPARRASHPPPRRGILWAQHARPDRLLRPEDGVARVGVTISSDRNAASRSSERGPG